MKPVIERYLRYAVSTIGGTGVETVVICWLSGSVFHSEFGISILSPCVGFECALLTNYLTAYFFVWRIGTVRRSVSDFFHRMPAYHASCLAGFIFKMLFLLPIRHISGLPVAVCNIVSLSIVGVLTFLMHDRYVFRRK